MSQKITLPMGELGTLDTNTNPVLLQGRGSRMLQNIGDLYGDEKLSVQPGYNKILGAPMLADYTTGTVSVSNGSKVVTGSSTAFLANAHRGDIFIGPDLKYYVIDEKHSDTEIVLRQPYDGTTATGASYTIRHRVWGMAPFYAGAGSISRTQDQNLASVTAGTFTTTEATKYGVELTPSVEVWHHGLSAQALSLTSYWGYDSINNKNRKTKVTKVVGRFHNLSNVSVDGIWMNLSASKMDNFSVPGLYVDTAYPNFNSTLTFTITIKADSSGTIGATLTNATTGEVSVNTAKGAYYAFSGAVSLAANTTYWIHVEQGSTGWDYEYFYTKKVNVWISDETSDTSLYSGLTPLDSAHRPEVRYYVSEKLNVAESVGWHTLTGKSLQFSFFKYPTSGTYLTDVIDVGFTPVSAGTLTINRTYHDSWNLFEWSGAYQSSFTGVSFDPRYHSHAASSGATLTWKLEGSADNSSWVQIVTGQTALTYSITDYYRYYRVTFTLASTAGLVTPCVSGVSFDFLTTADNASDINKFLLVGCGPNLYTQAKASATTISTTEVPTGTSRFCQYQRHIFWVTGGQAPKYWDGVAAAAALVSAKLKSDGSAGTDPPVRADGITYHNDKLFLYRNVASPTTYSGTSTAQTDTVTTDSGASFTTTGDGTKGWRLYPDVTNFPLKWFPITSGTGTALTATGAKMNSLYGTNSPAVAGDTYRALKNYRKSIFYSTEVEPADWPSTSFLTFGDESGDIVQCVISWKGRLMVVCSDELWRVTGYGPSTPWEKEILGNKVGTLSPFSVVDGGDALYWWATDGIVMCNGGYSRPEVFTTNIRDIVPDNVNDAMRDDIMGVSYRGLVLWSYPTADSNVNNRTLVFNPRTGRFVLRTFGMYAPTVQIGEDNEEQLIFWEPTSGCLCQYDAGLYSFSGSQQEVLWQGAPAAPTSPVEDAQYLYVKVCVQASETLDVEVLWNADYGTTFNPTGTLVPVSSSVTGRTSVNPVDTAYICRLPHDARGPALALQFRCSSVAALEIMSVDITADPTEANTYQ